MGEVVVADIALAGRGFLVVGVSVPEPFHRDLGG